MRNITTTRLRLLALGTACTLLGAAAGGGATAYQGHMWNALHALQNANAQLEMASGDKGGHRDNAIGLINQAINEVNAGIAYAQ